MFCKNNTFVLQGVLFYVKKSGNFVNKMKKYIFLHGRKSAKQINFLNIFFFATFNRIL